MNQCKRYTETHPNEDFVLKILENNLHKQSFVTKNKNAKREILDAFITLLSKILTFDSQQKTRKVVKSHAKLIKATLKQVNHFVIPLTKNLFGIPHLHFKVEHIKILQLQTCCFYCCCFISNFHHE